MFVVAPTATSAKEDAFPFFDFYAKKIEQAHEKLKGHIKRTPLVKSCLLSKITGVDVYLKCEYKQVTGAFKERGAFNALLNLNDTQKAAGVITASAGNHAQGVARAAKELGIIATIVMPKNTQLTKIEGVKRYGANIVLHGNSFDEAKAHSKILQEQSGQTYIDPFDNDDVIAGQGTIAIEIVEQFYKQNPGKKLEAIFVQVGGGGLLAGIAAYVHARYPEVKVHGVEPEKSDCLNAALKAGKPVEIEDISKLADGVAVKIIGQKTFAIACKLIKRTITVSDDAICAAAVEIEGSKGVDVFPEAAGAVSVAGLKKYAQSMFGRKKQRGALIAIVSGKNVDLERKIYMMSRAPYGQKKVLLLSVGVPKTAGTLRRFCEHLNDSNHGEQIDISALKFRASHTQKGHFLVKLNVANSDADFDPIAKNMRDEGFSVQNLTNSRIANDNDILGMAGGRPSFHIEEKPYTVEFDERPGALLDFLSDMQSSWNITLFQYEKTGSPKAKVTIGLQVPDKDLVLLESFLKKYKGEDISKDPLYRMHLEPPPLAKSQKQRAATHHSPR